MVLEVEVSLFLIDFFDIDDVDPNNRGDDCCCYDHGDDNDLLLLLRSLSSDR
jgi:hypothetical protein